MFKIYAKNILNWRDKSETDMNFTACCLFASLIFASLPVFAQKAMGVFEQTADIGPVMHAGKTEYDSKTQTYRLSGSGANIWLAKDEFHYAWKSVKGDLILQCRGKLLGTGVDPHRKFGWMVRAGLETDAPMVAATVHGDGLTAIQYRKRAGANIEEVKSPVNRPDVIELERRGRSFLPSRAIRGGRRARLSGLRAKAPCQ